MAGEGGAYAASLETIQEARIRIGPHAHVTPILTCQSLDNLAGRALFFKCEAFQKGGAFKFRGACNAVFSLPEDQAAKGVVTHSSGNHGGALALAAKLRGIPAHIVVPQATPNCKVDAIRAYGGQVVFSDRSIDAREAACSALMAKTGATLIPPYNYGPVISGQGTMGLEILEQVPDGLDAIVVPVSGGGMISGIAMAIKSVNPAVKILAAEPTGSNDAADVARSLSAGELVPCKQPITMAEGLQGRLGDKTWPIVRDFVDGVVTVGEEEILRAMQLYYERMKVAVEPSGAAALAAVLSRQFQGDPANALLKRVGVIISGGNVDLGGKGVWGMSLWKAG